MESQRLRELLGLYEERILEQDTLIKASKEEKNGLVTEISYFEKKNDEVRAFFLTQQVTKLLVAYVVCRKEL